MPKIASYISSKKFPKTKEVDGVTLKRVSIEAVLYAPTLKAGKDLVREITELDAAVVTLH